jgi:hypothetical protein
MMNRFCALLPLLTATPALAQTIGANPAITAVVVPPAPANDTAALALKLANPVAALISLPMQMNFDGDIGPKVAGERQGERITLNIQPVIPISLNSDWNMISRTILPVVWQNDIIPRFRQPVRAGRHGAKPVLQPGGTEGRDLGRWAGAAGTDRHRPLAVRRQMGRRADRGGTQTDGHGDGRRAGQSNLVVCRQFGAQ